MLKYNTVKNNLNRLCVLISILLFFSNLQAAKLTCNYIDYNRGLSLPTHADIHIKAPGRFDLMFKHVYLEDRSFFPDNSLFPAAFFKNLLQFKLVDAVKGATEPYYGIRFIHFWKTYPHLGIGLDFIHFKVFVPSRKQIVHIQGKDLQTGAAIDEWDDIHKYLASFNVSHGVNHVSLMVVYRQMYLPSPEVPAGLLQPYIGFSFGPCIPHPELRLAGDTSKNPDKYQFGFPNLGGGLTSGIRVQPWPHFGFYCDYKFTFTMLWGLYFDNGRKGEIDLAFVDNHFTWGVSWAF
ncbi:MAG TPA: hypothetical protein VKS21_00630 [Spirochaetota bacterium]|nr:hypothetical protein [Spirochaetota bacterium]